MKPRLRMTPFHKMQLPSKVIKVTGASDTFFHERILKGLQAVLKKNLNLVRSIKYQE